MSVHFPLVSSEIFERSAPVPLYYQLKEWLSSRILSGDLAPGTRLPGEYELCEKLGISRGVVRQALSELRYEGLVHRARGKGTFVSEPKTTEGLIEGLRGLADDAALRGKRIESKVLLRRVGPASAAVASALELTPGDPVVEIERLRALDGVPQVLVLTYLPATMVPGLLDHELGGQESLYRVLREEYGLSILSSVRRVEAIVADSREARLLQVSTGDPLLVLRSVGYTTGRRPFDYFIAHHRGDLNAFEVVLPGPTASVGSFASVPLPEESSTT